MWSGLLPPMVLLDLKNFADCFTGGRKVGRWMPGWWVRFRNAFMMSESEGINSFLKLTRLI